LITANNESTYVPDVLQNLLAPEQELPHGQRLIKPMVDGLNTTCKVPDRLSDQQREVVCS